MNGYPHRLLVKLAGANDAYDPATGERVESFYEVNQEQAAAYLPHQCDEWIIGHGATADVIAELRKLCSEVDAAISYLGQQTKEPT
ncbi:hypothetical protein ABZY44_23840 [Streptomyces sp. NPDC006544]|uniref:hypothetical protein n=1 Tax=Streptomyces sp. NPDC006544 TaxID=3154583 RepID=UPI0033BE3539